MSDALTFLDAGDCGLTVELGEAVDEATNALVIALDKALAAQDIPGIVEMVPTYRSLSILFDPVVIPKQVLRERVLAVWPPDAAARGGFRRWTIPVLYGGEAGEDLEEVARQHGLTPEEVINLHAGAEYRVYMIGFAPGFAYLGGLPEKLHTSRRTDPRLQIPPSSISIGGKQAAICPPLPVPSGWHLLGRTPVRTYDPARKEPFLLSAGDRIRFRPVSAQLYREMARAAEAGDVVAEVETIDG
ncbi:5-oxoprolinase subunit PxpB [Microvirga antarctica]|uniref:5-oxoprolinase subunit PxpB n=1 Tax=Microvirga antarctica TaxID=2819233 RepID=UPI001B30B1D1|nr:5-oxoprolinase subunit PxpB [Microvirga antarctica]